MILKKFFLSAQSNFVLFEHVHVLFGLIEIFVYTRELNQL